MIPRRISHWGLNKYPIKKEFLAGCESAAIVCAIKYCKEILMFSFLDDFKPYGHWLLRIALASVFVIHGIGNFMNMTGFAAAMHVPHYVAVMLVLAEIGGGVLVLSGSFLDEWMTRMGALLLVPVLLIVMFMTQSGDMGFTLSKVHVMSGMEYLIVMLLVSLYVLLKGNKT
jgi:putative oxidoreductase